MLPASDDDASNPIGGLIKIVLGVLLLLMARQAVAWSARPATPSPALPDWMKAIDTMTAGRAPGSASCSPRLNPKNLLMAAGAGVIIGGPPPA